MEDLLNLVISKNKEYSPEQIVLSPYCERKMIQRTIEEDAIRKSLSTNKDLIYAKKQKNLFQGKEEDRYKLIYRISTRYYLIIVVSYNKSILKVINAIKTSKNLEAKWQKNIKKS